MSGRCRTTTRPLRVVLVSALLAAMAHACGAPSANDRSSVRAPSRDTFVLVGVMLDRRCGTLDCHGTSMRSFRLYGQSGMRLDAKDRPGDAKTTAAELEADYRSVVGLEPEVMSAVVGEGGRGPERLTLLRKAREMEHHLGGKTFLIGGDPDLCFTSWLTGKVDDAACTRAIQAIDPLLDAPP